MATAPFRSESVDSATAYAYYYADKHPSYFVAFLGAGRQGAAILVRSAINGKLYVRKREQDNITHTSKGTPMNDPGANAMEHANIVQRVSQTKIRSSTNPGKTTTADLWRYCSGGDLGQFLLHYAKRSEVIPEPVIWRLMRDLLLAMLHLHTNDIVHCDLIRDNVFLHWPEPTSPNQDPDSIPPTFLLGDFGASFTLPASEKQLSRRGIDCDAEAVYYDLRKVSEHVSQAMLTGPDGHLAYSPALQRAADRLCALPRYLQRFRIARACDDPDQYARIVSPLLQEIKTGLQEADDAAAAAVMNFKHVRPPTEKALADMKPMMMRSKAAMLLGSYRPPGPWCIAEFTSEGKLRCVDLEQKYCVDEAHVTSQRGLNTWKPAKMAEVEAYWSTACVEWRTTAGKQYEWK